MFDGLQEGIIVVQDEQVTFMNEISNKILSEITNLDNFFKNRDKKGEHASIDNVEHNLFYLFSSDSDRTKKNKKNK
jgi:hypothetical protein